MWHHVCNSMLLTSKGKLTEKIKTRIIEPCLMKLAEAPWPCSVLSRHHFFHFSIVSPCFAHTCMFKILKVFNKPCMLTYNVLRVYRAKEWCFLLAALQSYGSCFTVSQLHVHDPWIFLSYSLHTYVIFP